MTLKNKALFILAFGLGAGLMYVLDPERGRRRRALIRDRVTHGGHVLENAGTRVTGYSRDLRNRARGAVAEVRSRMQHEDEDDSVIEARVRSELGRKVPNFDALNVSFYDGKVTLRGTVSSTDARRARSAARSVRGVHEVEDLLHVSDGPAGVVSQEPAL